ncbi:hypothetical protein [Pseudobacteriovorax antillogorgiicola]|uniref:Uncharacterized protein n=1 Tax=Pseudobacteriovorax antillogorgiicola TaxID=1513793 RepID=A0A1Y6C258_9BACT|nr:hypothetical protein [Pseudobacteriovorax antillogorgiicola]TCS50786.1 hypothetical protein EDD56_112169 [Pseudobacteriovorax antillogorgiicola]SMF41500.1 hypothetical protein SAMN06296036_112168 [Pseudobacteriovorax antillogorgiicola]
MRAILIGGLLGLFSTHALSVEIKSCTTAGLTSKGAYLECEQLLQKGSYDEILDNIVINEGNLPEVVSEAVLSRVFYKSAAWFGTFIRSKPEHRCSYGEQGLISINRFLRLASSSLEDKADEDQIAEWMFRSSIFQGIIAKSGCDSKVFDQNSVDFKVNQVLEEKIKLYLIDNRKRRKAFGSVYVQINDLMKSTGDIVSKLEKAKVEGRMVDGEISTSEPIGNTTDLVWEFAGRKGTIRLNKLRAKNNLREKFFDEFPDARALSSQTKAFKEARENNAIRGRKASADEKDIAEFSSYFEGFAFRSFQADLNSEASSISRAEIELKRSSEELNSSYRQYPEMNHICDAYADMYFCKEIQGE